MNRDTKTLEFIKNWQYQLAAEELSEQWGYTPVTFEEMRAFASPTTKAAVAVVAVAKRVRQRDVWDTLSECLAIIEPSEQIKMLEHEKVPADELFPSASMNPSSSEYNPNELFPEHPLDDHEFTRRLEALEEEEEWV